MFRDDERCSISEDVQIVEKRCAMSEDTDQNDENDIADDDNKDDKLEQPKFFNNN